METLVMDEIVAYYKNKKVFVTGHTGFKGSWLVTWLFTMGADVKGYALEPEDENCLFNQIHSGIKINSIIADIRNKEKIEQEILSFKPDIIFHLAAQALVRRSYEIPSETFEVNVIGTTNLLEAVNKLPGKCTVILVTTDKVYANQEIDYHYHEDDVLGGYDPYSASKAATELAINSFRNSFFNVKDYANHQKAIASVRAGNVIGGGDFSKDRIIPDIVRALKQNKPIDIRNQFAVRPWQHVLEPLGGYLCLGMLLNAGAAQYSGAYNFGPQPKDHLSVRELVEIAIECWGAGDWFDKSDSTQPHEAGLLKLNISKAMQKLRWTPKMDSRESIKWTIDWYRQPLEKLVEYTFLQIKNYQQK